LAKSKIYFSINMAFYLDIVILSIVISNFGQQATNGFFVVSPYFFIFIFASYFKIFQPNIRKYYGLSFFTKVLLVLLGYIAGKYAILSTEQVLLFCALLCLIFVSYMLDNYIFHSKKFKDVFLSSYKIPDLTADNISIIVNDEKLANLLDESKKMISKLHFNTFCLGFSYTLIIMSIIFMNSNIVKIVGIALMITSLLLCLYILIIFFRDFIISKKIDTKLGVCAIVTSLFPYSLYMFQGLVLRSSNTYVFVFLILFILPYWFIHKNEAKSLWMNFMEEYKEKTGANNV